jgi:hypothetical protein
MFPSAFPFVRRHRGGNAICLAEPSNREPDRSRNVTLSREKFWLCANLCSQNEGFVLGLAIQKMRTCPSRQDFQHSFPPTSPRRVRTRTDFGAVDQNCQQRDPSWRLPPSLYSVCFTKVSISPVVCMCVPSLSGL